MVYDENNNPIGNAEISVAGLHHDVTSGKEQLVCEKPDDIVGKSVIT